MRADQILQKRAVSGVLCMKIVTAHPYEKEPGMTLLKSLAYLVPAVIGIGVSAHLMTSGSMYGACHQDKLLFGYVLMFSCGALSGGFCVEYSTEPSSTPPES